MKMLKNESQVYQRDAFWSEIYQIARRDDDVVVVSADMGAPALDDFRKNCASQFVNVGIAEQNAILIASGLAMMGKKVYTYAIAPFITLRCLEQIRVQNAIMNIPITMVGVGSGFGYDDSGPTHHLIEDITVMRAFPNIDIISVTDAAMAKKAAELTYHSDRSVYLRLERQLGPGIYDETDTLDDGMKTMVDNAETVILSTGAMTYNAIEIANDLKQQGLSVGVIDIYKFPLNDRLLMEKIKKAKQLFSLEEHFLPGGFGSMIAEVLVDHNINIPLKRLGLSHDKSYCYVYGGREEIHKYYGIASADITAEIRKTLGK
jgi:transketolase